MSVNLPPSPGGGPTEHAVEHALAPVEAGATQATTEAAADTRGTSVWGAAFQRPVSYTHLTLPTKRIV